MTPHSPPLPAPHACSTPGCLHPARPERLVLFLAGSSEGRPVRAGFDDWFCLACSVRPALAYSLLGREESRLQQGNKNPRVIRVAWVPRGPEPAARQPQRQAVGKIDLVTPVRASHSPTEAAPAGRRTAKP